MACYLANNIAEPGKYGVVVLLKKKSHSTGMSQIMPTRLDDQKLLKMICIGDNSGVGHV